MLKKKTINYGKMDPVWKRRWVKALRGRHYVQSHGQLRNNAGHCCLGVLCDIYDSTRWSGAGDLYSYSKKSFNSFTLPDRLRRRLKIRQAGAERLVAMNDGLGEGRDLKRRGFRAIANWIEKNL